MPVPKPSKPKGCYNCMKRRIICDRTEPRCNKCHKKGLECTGFGIRYRFNDGVASRGHLKGKKQPTPTSENQSSVWKEAILSQPKHLIWLNERFPGSPVKKTDTVTQGASDSSMIAWLNIEDFGNDNSGSVESTAFEVDRTECPLVFYEPIELLDYKTRFLFSHCNTTFKSHYKHKLSSNSQHSCITRHDNV